MTLLNMQDNTTSGKPLPCEHCESGDPVVSRCTDCSVFMCEFCVTAHKRITVTKRHQILSLAEVQKLGSKALVQPAFCVKHTGETLKLYCETCQETICRDCTIVDHREHKYNFVADVADRERKVVQDTLNKTKAKERAVVEGLRVPDCNFRESLAKLEKSKLLIICLKFTFGELSSKIVFECSGNFWFSRILEKTK